MSDLPTHPFLRVLHPRLMGRYAAPWLVAILCWSFAPGVVAQTVETCALGKPGAPYTAAGWYSGSFPGATCIDQTWYSDYAPVRVFEDGIRWTNHPWEPWESLRIRSGESGRANFRFKGLKEDPNVPGLPTDPEIVEPHTIGIRELRLSSIDMINKAVDLLFLGNDPSITLDDSSVKLEDSTLISTSSDKDLSNGLTLLSNSGINTIEQWSGQAGGEVSINVMAGSELTFKSETRSRLEFTGANSTLNVDGKLSFNRGKTSFTKNKKATSVVTGGLVVDESDTVLELAGDLVLDGGFIELSYNTVLKSITPEAFGFPKVVMRNAEITSAGLVDTSSLIIAGDNTINLENLPGDRPTLTAGSLIAAAGDNASLTCHSSLDTANARFTEISINTGVLNLMDSCQIRVTGPYLFSRMIDSSLNISSDAGFWVGFPSEAGLALHNTVVSNEGKLLVNDGELGLSGATEIIGSGATIIRSNSVLSMADDTASSSITQTELLLERDATMQLILYPDANYFPGTGSASNQTLTVNAELQLGVSDTPYGLLLPADMNLLIYTGSDVTLPNDTKLVLVDYSGPVTGYFKDYPDDSLFVLGMNHYRIRYSDPDYGATHAGNDSVITLTVENPVAPNPVSLTYPPVAVAVDGTISVSPYTQNATNPSYALVSPPPGVSIDSATGVVTITAPSSAQTFSVTVALTHGSPATTLQTSFQVTVDASTPSPYISYSQYSLIAGQVITPIKPVVVGFDPGTLSFSLADGSLPDGLLLDNDNGEISGTPTTATGGFVAPTVRAADNAMHVDLEPLPIEVMPTLSYPSINGMVWDPLSSTPAVSPSTQPGSFAVTGGTLPTGLSIDAVTGVISGTPTEPSPPTDFVTVTYTTGSQSVSATLLVTVNNPSVSQSVAGGPGGVTATLNVSGCQTVVSASFVPAPDTPSKPAGFDFPYQLLDFELDDCSTAPNGVVIDVDYSSPIPDGAVFFKEENGQYSTYPATISGSNTLFVLTDNGSGDEDSGAGRIHDPSGIAVPSASPTVLQPVPALPLWLLSMLAVIAGLIGAVRLRSAQRH